MRWILYADPQVDPMWRSLTTDLESRIEYANAAVVGSSGYTAAELIGQTPSLLQSGQTPRTTYESLWATLARGEVWRGEFINRRKDRTIYTEFAIISPIRQSDGCVTHYLAIKEDITERKKTEELRSFLAQAGNRPTAEPFFNAVARRLADTLDSFYVCIDRLEGDGLTARTLAIWCDDHFEDNVSYALKDTPCGDVVDKAICCFPASASLLFPRDQVLQDLKAESYVGTTLTDHTGRAIGLIAVISRQPLSNQAFAESILKLVSIRASGELERVLNEEKLEDLVANRTESLAAANHRLALSDQRLSAMLAMSQKANTLNEQELLQIGIETAVKLTASEIGYLHFVNDDQQTIALYTWSEGTLRHCTAAYDSHYPVSEAGMWAAL